jgi:GT2 family glycosyltransferase
MARLPCRLVIPVHNKAALTQACLDTVLDQSPEPAEIVVVDDGSTDATPELLRRYGDRVRVIRHEVPQSFARASNAGAAGCQQRYLLFLNNDTIPAEGWLEAMVEAAETHPAVGAVGAKLLWPDGSIQHAGVCFGADGFPYHIYSGFPADHPAVCRRRRFQSVTAGCALFRRSAFEAAGGFDPEWVNGYEDVDLCLRLGALGHEILYEPEAVVTHLESATRGRSYDSMRENYRLYKSRWADRARPDDLATVVEDGLIELDNRGHDRPLVRVDPLLAETRRDGTDARLEELVTEQARRVRRLTDDNTRLLVSTAEKPDVHMVVRADGSVSVVDSEGWPVDSGHAGAFPQIQHLSEKMRPLRTEVLRTEPVRVNLLFPEIQAAHFFGGYISKFQLAARLIARGHRVRAIAVDGLDPALRDSKGLSAVHAGAAAGISALELIDGSDRSQPVPVSPQDRFIATTWWTAHIAHAAVGELGGERFVYLIQEYEPYTFPMGSFAGAADASYRLPHFALFSTELLRDHFAQQGIGVFANGNGNGDNVTFRNAITSVDPPDPERLARRGERRLLMYARPRPSEARNMFELSVVALKRAIAEGIFGPGWSFTGVGASGSPVDWVELELGARLDLLPRLAPSQYEGTLRSHDLGVALMHTPHPSLVPIEMAAAGMPTVTSTFGVKTPERLAEISPNLIAAEPTVDSLVEAMGQAVERVEDFGGRIEGAAVDWSRTASEAFSDPVLESLERFLDACAPGR